MMDDKKIINWLKLRDVKGLGPKKILKLIDYFETVDNLLKASGEDLLKTRIFKEKMVVEWEEIKKSTPEKYESILHECKENNISILPIFEEGYPTQLKILPDPPINLFLKGDTTLLQKKKVAIVGSRESGDKSREWTFKKAGELANKDIVIVSGGARGIDYEAHKAALITSRKTICVLGSGILELYPQENEELFHEILKKGLLVSEQIPSFRGGRISLLARNRITSGISDCLLAVTSKNGGGAMTQLDIAHKQRIPIFCPSLSLNLQPNEGIKRAIEEYNAREIQTIEPIIEELNKPKPSFLQSKL
jgi:DNA processing protein